MQARCASCRDAHRLDPWPWPAGDGAVELRDGGHEFLDLASAGKALHASCSPSEAGGAGSTLTSPLQASRSHVGQGSACAAARLRARSASPLARRCSDRAAPRDTGSDERLDSGWMQVTVFEPLHFLPAPFSLAPIWLLRAHSISLSVR